MLGHRLAETPSGPALRAATDDVGLPDDLRDRVDQIRRMALAIRTAEAEYVYQLALLAKAAAAYRFPDGSSATTVCAAAIGLGRTTLAAFALVAARWTAGELRQLLTLRDIRGQPLSVTHLLLVARLPRTIREPWIGRILAEGLDVRSLKRAMRHGSSGHVVVVDPGSQSAP
jgi:hypothetical protein